LDCCPPYGGPVVVGAGGLVVVLAFGCGVVVAVLPGPPALAVVVVI
jgi:hypothetical protein